MAIYDDDARIYADLIRDKNRLKAQIASGALVAYQIKKDDSGIIVFWSETKEKNPKNIWNENFEYRRLGFGTKNYSGMSTTTLKKKILKQLRERENATP